MTAPLDLVGRTLSHYTITAKIGAGGMGVVYKAVDTRLNRPVAIKVIGLPPDATNEHKRRFIGEAKAASALNHPNIVTVYEVDSVDGVEFIAMEYIPGRTLHDCIGAKGLPTGEALRYLRQVADALSAAHAAGIVHRDLKPSNIIVADGGLVKLVDFGLAKLADPLAAVASVATATAPVAMTGPGSLIGTVAYMSPEQTRGAPMDQRVDVWAFGCVLYECLTGRRAFDGPSYGDVVAQIVASGPDLGTLPASVPSSLRQIIDRCLRKDPNERPRFVDPVMLDLARDAIETTDPRSRRRDGRLVPLTITAIVAVAILWWFATRPRTVSEQPVVRLSAPFDSRPRATDWDWPMLAVSPDGSSLVYASVGGDGERRLHYRRLDRANAVTLAGTEGAVSPFFSPDGKWIAFFSMGRLKKISVPDGVVQVVCDSPVPYGGVWAPDNTILLPAPSFTGGLMRVSALGGTPQSVTTRGEGEIAHRWPTLSNDGSVVVFTTSNSTGPGLEEPRLVAQSLLTSKRAVLPVEATFARFAPDGRHLLLIGGGAVTTVSFDPATLSISGSPSPIMEGVLQASTGAAQVSASRSTLTFLEGGPETRRLVWVDRQGAITPLDAPPRLYAHPRLSPDGKTVAVTITGRRNDIWTYDVTRGTLSRLTTQGSGNAYPIWTPDGKRITYVSAQDGKPQNAFWKSADGSGAEERLIASANTQVTETWVRDGKTLVLVELRPQPTGWDILTLPLAAPRQPVPFLESPYCDCTPQISPSGRYLAHTSDESGRQEVQIRSFPNPGTKVTVSTDGGALAAWRADERELYYVSNAGMMVVPITPGPPLVAGKPTLLFAGEFARIQGKNFDVTADGQRFLAVQTTPRERPSSISVVLNWQREVEPLRQK